MELRYASNLAHLTATTGGMTKQGRIKSIQKILHTIFPGLKKNGVKENTSSDLKILTVSNCVSKMVCK